MQSMHRGRKNDIKKVSGALMKREFDPSELVPIGTLPLDARFRLRPRQRKDRYNAVYQISQHGLDRVFYKSLASGKMYECSCKKLVKMLENKKGEKR